MKTILLTIMTGLGSLLVLAAFILFVLKVTMLGIGPDLGWPTVVGTGLAGVAVAAVGSGLAYTTARREAEAFMSKGFDHDFFRR